MKNANTNKALLEYEKAVMQAADKRRFQLELANLRYKQTIQAAKDIYDKKCGKS